MPDYPNFPDRGAIFPIELTRDFFVDYQVWNDFAYAQYQPGGADELAETSYDALIAKYCGTGKAHQLLSFSSSASFTPETDTIESVTTAADKQIVLTKHVNEWGHEQFHEFEYHRSDGRWLLDELYYLDEYDDNKRLKLL